MVDASPIYEALNEAREVVATEFSSLRARIAALEAQLAERVKVKALEWTRGWMNAEAQTEIGQYTITYRRDGSFEWGIGILKGWASSWDAAKAAAQADYERRILSALEATPPAPKDGEPTRVYEPYPGAFDDILGPDFPPAPKVTEEMVDRILDAAGDHALFQYGFGALHHSTDRQQIKKALSGDAS